MNKISMYANSEEMLNYCIDNVLNPVEAKLAQMYALYEIAEWKRAQIAELLEYTPNTISTKRRKMWDYAELAECIFLELVAEVIEAETAKEVEVTLEPTVLYRRFKNGKNPVPIILMPGCGENIVGQQAVYFFKFYNSNELEFNKIGTTSKDIIKRLRDEIGEYAKKYDIQKVEVHRMRSCGEAPAEGAESELRSKFIKEYPMAFRKNDRFFNVDIAPEVFDKILNEYFN